MSVEVETTGLAGFIKQDPLTGYSVHWKKLYYLIMCIIFWLRPPHWDFVCDDMSALLDAQGTEGDWQTAANVRVTENWM